MKQPIWKVCAALTLGAVAATGQAREPVDVGFISTLSTPAGYIGEDQRDGMLLAIQQGGGALGGVPVHLIVEDDGLKPGSGKQSAERMLQSGVKVFTGINFSNVLGAVAPTVTRQGGFYLSNNAGPSTFAGKQCNPDFFSVSMQNDSWADTAAMAANQLGIKKVVLIVPAYQAGRDAVAGFKRAYKGDVLAEIFTKLDQTDFSVELARLRALAPDGLFEFLPGGAGINFAKQFANSGLKDRIKVVTTEYSMDQRMLAASGDAAEGYYLSTQWNPDGTPASQAFVKAYTDTYHRAPTVYGAMAYDTALLLGSALKAVDGDVKGKPDAFRAALRKADFGSIRGQFRFGPNQFPIQDWYLRQVRKDDQGKLYYASIGTIVKDHGDDYAAQCHMPK